jgi:transposase
MRVKKTTSKNSESLYIIKSVTIDGKNTSKIVEKLGTIEEVTQKANGHDPYEWARKRAAFLTQQEKDQNKEVMLSFSPNKRIIKDTQRSFNVGYMPLQKIYHELSLDKLSKTLSENCKLEYDLNAVFSSLLVSRILYPASKLSTYHLSKNFLEKQPFDLHHIYRSLDVFFKYSQAIQQHLYEQSKHVVDRETSILYYDCTNYFFEIEEADGLKQYGKGKEHRPNPIVQMGLFLDGSGIPLAFNITPGNTNEQVTLQPLEKQIIKDFGLSNIVVCTDAGLSSIANRKFNNHGKRSYITVQSLKKIKAHLKDWALDSKGWKTSNSKQTIDLSTIDLENNKTTYYKERWINENGLEERLIISYSPKYALYQKSIRAKQVQRAVDKVTSNKKPSKRSNPNDPQRFIEESYITKDGEAATESAIALNYDKIAKEAQYDGFYAVVTTLEDSIESIIKINNRRWEIEETFRIMKSEFKARPVYLSKDQRIEAHFLICFIAMVMYRILEKKTKEQYTVRQLTDTLRSMNVLRIHGEGYIPTFSRTDISDDIQKIFSLELDSEIITTAKMNRNKRISKTKTVRKT